MYIYLLVIYYPSECLYICEMESCKHFMVPELIFTEIV